MITGRTKIYGLYGWPVEHTFSPAMHNAAFKRLEMDACYVAFPVHPDRLEDAMRSISALSIQGVNVTVPHKERAAVMLSELSEEARLMTAVNTIEVRGDRLIGHNTDGRGFLRSLREDLKFEPKGRSIFIIGAGGAGRAVGFSLAIAGATGITIYDKDVQKGSALARDIREKTGADVFAVDDIMNAAGAAKDADCIVNATPLGMKKTDLMPLDAHVIRKGQIVCDLIYNPPETRLLRSAKARGARTLNGLGMLLYQGVLAFEIWTGKKAPVGVMKAALIKQITTRTHRRSR